MNIEFKVAEEKDAEHISDLVMKLTEEISVRTQAKHFHIDRADTLDRCRELIRNGLYGAIIGYQSGDPVALSTFVESHALYAGGKIGIIPEFYVVPKLRSSGVGERLIERVRGYGKEHGWSSMDMCTPPLPEFERTLACYERNGMAPDGGRKMRQDIAGS